MTEKKLYSYDLIFKPDLFHEELLAVGVGNLLDELERIYLSAVSTAEVAPENRTVL